MLARRGCWRYKLGGWHTKTFASRSPATRHAIAARSASSGVWNSRLQFTGDFETLRETLAAIDAACPEADRIRCYEYTVDDEYPREVAALLKSDGEWHPGDSPPAEGV